MIFFFPECVFHDSSLLITGIVSKYTVTGSQITSDKCYFKWNLALNRTPVTRPSRKSLHHTRREVVLACQHVVTHSIACGRCERQTDPTDTGRKQDRLESLYPGASCRSLKFGKSIPSDRSCKYERKNTYFCRCTKWDISVLWDISIMALLYTDFF